MITVKQVKKYGMGGCYHFWFNSLNKKEVLGGKEYERSCCRCGRTELVFDDGKKDDITFTPGISR